MTRILLITSLFALGAPTASAGDLDFLFRWKTNRQVRRVEPRHDHRHEEICNEHCIRTYVPGRYETVTVRVLVPARHETIWEPDVYETRYDHCGRPYRVCVRKGYYRTVCTPAHYENRCERVLTPGHWVYDCNTRNHRHH